MFGIAAQPPPRRARGRRGRRGRRRPRAPRGAAPARAAAARSRPAARPAPAPRAAPASGMSRSPVCGQRRPRRAIRRRWIATARSNSISCSVTAHASASHGSGRRGTRSRGRARTERRSRGRRGSARRTGAGRRRRRWRSACARSPRGRRARRAARAANSTRSRRGCATADEDGLPAQVQQRCSAAPRRRSMPSGEPRRRRNGHGGRTSTAQLDRRVRARATAVNRA